MESRVLLLGGVPQEAQSCERSTDDATSPCANGRRVPKGTHAPASPWRTSRHLRPGLIPTGHFANRSAPSANFRALVWNPCGSFVPKLF